MQNLTPFAPFDAPETRDGQPFWQASRDQLAALVAGKTVDVVWGKRDRNGRIIGWVMVDEGIWVNKVMVVSGYAWWFERYAPDVDQLREAQEDVREGKRGLRRMLCRLGIGGRV